MMVGKLIIIIMINLVYLINFGQPISGQDKLGVDFLTFIFFCYEWENYGEEF